jgi:hypothetical protein
MEARRHVPDNAIHKGIAADSDDFGQRFRAEVGHLFRLMSAGHSN